MLLIHWLLIKSAVLYYTLLWMDELEAADNVVHIIEEGDWGEEEHNIREIMWTIVNNVM